MENSVRIKPINDILCVKEAGCETIKKGQINLNDVGEKAYGLSCIPSEWTLPYFIISYKLFEEYKTKKDEIFKNWSKNVELAAENCNIRPNDPIIVRSNVSNEGLIERGKYISLEGKFCEWSQLVKKCFNDFIMQAQLGKINMSVIIQRRANQLLRGHISNERRVANEIRDWRGEFETALPRMFSISLRDWRKKINTNSYLNKPLNCPNDKTIKAVLSIPCTWATQQKKRIHFEWVFDGERIFLVQADEELDVSGVNPHSITAVQFNYNDVSSGKFPECLHLLEATDAEKYKSYSKIQNPLLYQKLGKSIAPLYILDDVEVLDQLVDGNINEKLSNDLRVLISRSLIIRTDIDTDSKEERQLLPRTCEIREMDAAISWIKNEYASLKEHTNHKVIFILHSFIPAFSSAFAYASPSDSIVKIEALWGLPEGLYYYSHDKYIVDTVESDISKLLIDNFKIEKDRNYKKYFVCPLDNGSWEVQLLAKPFDWNSSIPKDDWISEIALTTRRIAKAEGRSVSVMWFVGVDEEQYHCNVFPWFHEPYEYTEDKITPRNKFSFEYTFAVHTLQDVEQLENQTSNHSIKNILVQPIDERILRDRGIIDRVGKAARLLEATIILEGGILSHAYYQLIRTGARVEARNTFGRIQCLDYNKLVRDRIPEKIEKNGESAITAQLDKTVLIMMLKRKLVEESLEVFDAEKKDDLIGELADVLEVIDGIVKHCGIQPSDIEYRKAQKREKVGGFEKGVFLKQTSNNIGTNTGKIVIDDAPIGLQQELAKSTDLRKYSTANETLTKVKVPITLNEWEIRPSIKAENVNIVVRGVRKQGVLQMDISIFEEAKQMSLFEK